MTPLAWHADPAAVLGIAVLVLGYVGLRRAARARGRSPSVTAARWFAVAVALLVVALCSPLATT
ncbi:MAG: hypothetical protein ABR520_06440, partial [Mycobacteriales bacterium]